MIINIELFAAVADSVGKAQVQLSVPGPLTAPELLATFAAQFPQVAPLLKTSRVAVDQQYATEQTMIHDRSQVAIIPPVSGG